MSRHFLICGFPFKEESRRRSGEALCGLPRGRLRALPFQVLMLYDSMGLTGSGKSHTGALLHAAVHPLNYHGAIQGTTERIPPQILSVGE